MRLNWFLSSRVRKATDVCKHVRRLYNAQRDILTPQAAAGITVPLELAEADLKNGANDEAATKHIAELEKATDKWIKPYPNPDWRENVEVFLVAIVVAMAVRTFFLQPFKIPTGSMQPTLFGVTYEDLHDKPDVKIPGPLGRIWDAAVYGEIYHEIIAPEDCVFSGERGPMQHPLPFINKQVLYFKSAEGTFPETIWFGPDDTPYERSSPWGETGLFTRGVYHKGEPILRFKEITGDHLFVDRMMYNFRHPERGEVIVFKTKGIPDIGDQTQFYIKRLVGLPGENISIGEDQHARIDGVRLDASTPHFENVYGFKPGDPPQANRYSGHVLMENDSRAILRRPSDVLHVDLEHYAVFGDNTMNSWDSRFWHELPEDNVIGKSFFVYWPISKRFGWGHTLK